LQGFDILLTATEGKVRLAGYVSTPEQSELVGKIAGMIDGVKEVDNQLTIGDPRASGSTETGALKPGIVNAEQPQVSSSKTNAGKCSKDQGLSASASQSPSDPSPHIESKNTEQDQGPRVLQVLIMRPKQARVQWDLDSDEPVESHASVVPFRRDLAESSTYQLKLSNIPGRDGLEVSASLRILPLSSHTELYVAKMAIPVSFTKDDLDQVISGKAVTKVVFLEKEYVGNSPLDRVSTRFLAGSDLMADVVNDGSILAIVHVPAILAESKLHESTCTGPAAYP
jgi:hypothetical protein